MLILNDKHLDTLALANRETTRLLVLEGTIRSSKTVIAIQAFYFRVMNSKETLHLIAAKDLDAINNNLLECNGFGLLKLFGKNIKLKKDAVGSYYLSLTGYNQKKKKILLAGYSDTSKWKKVLGNTLGCILVDEANIANKQFIDECFSRQVSSDNPFTVWTLNGDNPDHYIYQEYINSCKALWSVPTSILADMLPRPNTRGWYYCHWTMDDNPIMTDEKIESASSIYPQGSYYYIIKILGERGRAEGTIFAQYIDNDTIMENIPWNDNKAMLDFEDDQIIYSVGLDLGNNDIKRGTVLTLTSIERQYKRVHVLERCKCQNTEVNKLCDEIANIIGRWWNSTTQKRKFNGVWIDSYGAIQLMLETLRDVLENRKIFIPVEPCLKFGDEKGRKARLDLILMLISQKRIHFNEKSKGCLSSLKKLVYNEKDGLPLDENQAEMDDYDSMCYSLTPSIRELTRRSI